jgi:hypothetical protein
MERGSAAVDLEKGVGNTAAATAAAADADAGRTAGTAAAPVQSGVPATSKGLAAMGTPSSSLSTLSSGTGTGGSNLSSEDDDVETASGSDQDPVVTVPATLSVAVAPIATNMPAGAAAKPPVSPDIHDAADPFEMFASED